MVKKVLEISFRHHMLVTVIMLVLGAALMAFAVLALLFGLVATLHVLEIRSVFDRWFYSWGDVNLIAVTIGCSLSWRFLGVCGTKLLDHLN